MLRLRVLTMLLMLSLVAATPGRAKEPEPRCARANSNDVCALYNVSIIELIANPDRFHGKPVAVVGFLNLAAEANGLYLHDEDQERSLFRNGLWVDVPRGWIASVKCKNQQYVLMQGIFNAKNTGHLGQWSGALESVTHCASWR